MFHIQTFSHTRAVVRPFLQLIFLSALVATYPQLVTAATFRVPEQFSTIQSAIDATSNLDTVLINDGTYTGDGNRDITFRGKSILLTSVNGPELTIVDCQADSINPHRGFIFDSGEDSLAILDGLTITNGFAPGDPELEESLGGGILCDSGVGPTIRNCEFIRNCSQNAGGGIAYRGANVRLSDSRFYGNCCFNLRIFVDMYGGGVFCLSSSGSLDRCTLDSNTARVGGGLRMFYSNIAIRDCVIIRNWADILYGTDPAFAGVGGGIQTNASTCTVMNCEISHNVAKTFFPALSDAGEGGGVAVISSNVTISHTTIVENVAEGWEGIFTGLGAGIAIGGITPSDVTIENTIIANNTDAEAIFVFQTSTAGLTCSNLFGNETGDWVGPIDSFETLNGNMSLDPRFCDPTIGDYGLAESSPCLPQNNSCSVQIGAHGQACTSTGVGEENPDILPSDFLALNNRPNPSNASTTISFTAGRREQYDLTIFNLLGQRVAHFTGRANIGANDIIWNASDAASGVYFMTLTTNNHTRTGRLVLLK